MQTELKRAALMARIDRLKAHQEHVKDSDGLRYQLDKAEAELRALELQEPRDHD